MLSQSRRGPFSRHFLIGSFLAAFLVVVTISYNNYRFARYKFVDFDEFILYQKESIFIPNHDVYMVVFYSSNIKEHTQKLLSLSAQYPILAIDFAQKRDFDTTDKIVFATASINTLLKLSRRFNVTELPSAFVIRRTKKNQFKQESDIVGL